MLVLSLSPAYVTHYTFSTMPKVIKGSKVSKVLTGSNKKKLGKKQKSQKVPLIVGTDGQEGEEAHEERETEEHDGNDDEVKRARGRPRKAAGPREKKAPKRAETPDYETAFEAAKSYVTLDFMLKEHAKGVKDASKAKSDAGKLLKTYFERNIAVDSLGPIECTRKPKKVVPNLDDLKQKVEDEVMQDPLRTGQLLAKAITERITNDGGQPAEPPQVSIKINKEAQASIANTHQQYMHEAQEEEENFNENEVEDNEGGAVDVGEEEDDAEIEE